VKSPAAGTGQEFYCRKKSGQEFPVEISLNTLETEEGPLISAAIRDISERKQMVAKRIQAEEALRRAYHQLRLRLSELADANQQLRHEIAERQRAEAELRRAFAMLDQHVNNTPLGVIEWEQDDAAGEPPRVRRWSGTDDLWLDGERGFRSFGRGDRLHLRGRRRAGGQRGARLGGGLVPV
jgi:PAS domain-containing protein